MPQSSCLQDVKRVQEEILVAERILLATLNFDFYIEHPHTFLLKKMEELDGNAIVICESRPYTLKCIWRNLGGRRLGNWL